MRVFSYPIFRGMKLTRPRVLQASFSTTQYIRNKWDLPVIEGLTQDPSDPENEVKPSQQHQSKKKPRSSEEQLNSLLSNVDEKAAQILKNRPELREKYLDLVQPEDELENGPSVPHGWRKNKQLPEWKRQNYALKEKFKGAAWRPNKKLSRETMEGIRALKQYYPEMNSGEIARRFKVPAESIRRILKGKWEPNEEELQKMEARWERRGERLLKNIKEKAWQESKAKQEEAEANLKERNIVRQQRGLSPLQMRQPKKKNAHSKDSKDSKKSVKRDISSMMF